MNIKDKWSSNPLAIANAFNTYFSHQLLKIYLLKISLERTLLIIMIQYLIYVRILDSLFWLYNSEILQSMKSRKKLLGKWWILLTLLQKRIVRGTGMMWRWKVKKCRWYWNTVEKLMGRVGIYWSDVSVLIFNLGTGWWCVVSFMPQLLNPPTQILAVMHWKESWVGPIFSLDSSQKGNLLQLSEIVPPHQYLCCQIVLLQKACTNVMHGSHGTASETQKSPIQFCNFEHRTKMKFQVPQKQTNQRHSQYK